MDFTKELLRKIKELLKEKIGDGNTFSVSTGPELCKGMACLGTPGEIAKLINAGYGHALTGVMVEWAAISESGRTATDHLPMVQLSHDQNGCVMHKDGKCLLMDHGLTPTMGALNVITGGDMETLLKETMIPVLVMEWTDSDNKTAIKFCLRSLERMKEISRNHMN